MLERRGELAGCQSAEEPDPAADRSGLSRPPNLLLVSLDTVRRDRTSVYGHEKPTTPTLESIAEQVIEKAKRTYRSVEEVAQLRAGRVRTLVKDTYHLKARKTLLRSSRDFKVKADQIHLG